MGPYKLSLLNDSIEKKNTATEEVIPVFSARTPLFPRVQLGGKKSLA